MCLNTDPAIFDELLPGLPNSIVLGNLLPRIPWHSRPVLRAVSKTWHAALSNPDPYTTASGKVASLSGLLLVHQHMESKNRGGFSRAKSLKSITPFEVPRALSMYEEDTKQWRLLPPIKALAPMRILHDCGIASAGGKVYVMGGYDVSKGKVSAEVFVLNIGGGKWEWERCKSMVFARCGFQSRANGGKIYVVGGQSSEGEPDPEAYDIEKNEWEVLPRVLRQDNIEWALVTYSGLAMVNGSLIAHGYWESQTGNVMKFYRSYDERERRWRGLYNSSNNSPWGTRWKVCSDVVEGVYDMRDGLLVRFNMDGGGGKWEAMDGMRACENAWSVLVVVEEGEGAQFVAAISTCAHTLVVGAQNRVVYTTLCKGDARFLSLWKGQIDHASVRVDWTKLDLPGGLYLCSGMCAFE